MMSVDVMVDAEVVLVPVGVVTVSSRTIDTCTLDPTMTRRIQAVANREVIGQRHSSKHLLYPTAWIESWSELIASEHTERLKIPCCRCWAQGIALQIHGRVVRKRVSILRTRKVPENLAPRFLRQDRPRRVSAFHETLTFVQEEEKCLVLDDGAAEAPSELILIQVSWLFAAKVS